MEASALYAFAQTRKKDIICIAHVTNSMAQSVGDFEQGIEGGSIDSRNLVDFILRVVRRRP